MALMASLQRKDGGGGGEADVLINGCLSDSRTAGAGAGAQVIQAAGLALLAGRRDEGNLAPRSSRGGRWSLALFSHLSTAGPVDPSVQPLISLSAAERNMFLITSRGD